MLSKIYLSQFNNKDIKVPEDDGNNISATEKLVREEIRKLNENTKEIKKIREKIRREENSDK